MNGRDDLLEMLTRPAWIYALGSLRFLDVNDVAVQVYGWSRGEFLAMTIVDIRPREDVSRLLANVVRRRRCQGGVTGPWRHLRRDGSVVDVLISFLSLPFLGEAARLVVVDAAAEVRASRAHGGASHLSPREREVFRLVSHGHTSQEIAERLRLSTKSVETYRARFMAKLNLKTRAEIVQYAIDHGVLAG